LDNTVFTHIEFLRRKTFTMEAVLVPNHNHYFYEMSYILKGCLQTEMDGKHYESEKNSIILIPPNAMHSHDSQDEYEVIYIGFYYNGLYGPLNQRTFDDSDGAILKILEKMLTEFEKEESYSESISQELQKIFIFNLLRLQDKSGFSSNNDDVLKYAVSYLQDHYYEDIDMQELAQSLGYSYHHFRHMFKQNFDMPPKQFLLNQRIQYAMKLLRNTDQSIASIAKNCGFASTNRFISAFKSIFNFSPMQYRNSDTVNLDICVFWDKDEYKFKRNDEIMPIK